MTEFSAEDNAVLYPEVFTTVDAVDSERAKELLKVNFLNRKPNTRRVSFYLKQMESGSWGLGDPLMFDKHGKLLNGQHRLMAVAKFPGSVPFVMLWGLDPKAKHYIDTGMSRTASQVTQISGQKYSYHNDRLAILRAMFIGSRLSPKSASAEKNAMRLWTDRAEVKPASFWIPLLEEHEKALDFALGNGRTKKGKLVNATSLAVIARAYYTQNHQQLNEFIHLLVNGQIDREAGLVTSGRDSESTAVNFRNYLIIDWKTKKRAIDSRFDLYCKTESALKAFLKGAKLSQFSPSRIEHFPLAYFD